MAINFDEREPVEKEPELLFTMDGVDYFMDPPGANIALLYAERVQEFGELVANAWVLRKCLGDDAYEALMDYDALEVDDLDTLTQVVVDQVLGRSTKNGVDTGPLPGSSGRASARRRSPAASKKSSGRAGTGKTSKRTSARSTT